jgi:phenylacetate-CoA ligase
LKKIKIEELLATNVPKSRLLKAFTSGSTGEPFGFYQDKEELFRRGINNFEEFRYAGFDLKKGKILIINLSSHKDLDSFGERVSIVDFENYEKRRNILYPKISILQPRLLISTPSHLERFLFFCEKDGFRPVIESVCYLGELMEEGLKKRIESFFGAVVYSTYGTRECSLIGIQCKSGLQHTAPWMNYVEVVNGQVIVTTFENKVMPFIRYSIGDEGVLLNETCKCGRSSQLIKFKGRAGGAIELSNKRLVPILYITQHIANKYSKKISKFQFQQDSYKQIQMRYVPNSKNESTAIEESLNIYLNSLFENQIEVVFHCVDYILPNDSGKTTLFIKNLK